jgi:hypothetical protein
MKLSELVKKIYDTNYNSECYVSPIRETRNSLRIRVEYGNGYWGLYEFYIRDNKIEIYNDMDLLPMNEFKWFYKLWVDEVEFVDDWEDIDLW